MKRKLIMVFLGAVAAVGFVGCASDDSADSHKRTAGQYIDDKVLVQKVKAALGDSEVYKFPDVKVETYQGTVQLTGFVETQEQKQKAQELARNIRGVASVKNDIMLKGEAERVRGTDANRNTTTSPNTTTTPNP
jgi:hyperosmotically inducible periplasmic protein